LLLGLPKSFRFNDLRQKSRGFETESRLQKADLARIPKSFISFGGNGLRPDFGFYWIFFWLFADIGVQ
jgi:hypothetical protein